MDEPMNESTNEPNEQPNGPFDIDNLTVQNLRVQSLVLQDGSGRDRAMLACHPDTNDPMLILFDKVGKRRFSLALSGENDRTSIMVNDANGVNRLVVTETDNEMMKEVDPENYTPETGISITVKDERGDMVCTLGTSGDFVHFDFNEKAAQAFFVGMNKALGLPAPVFPPEQSEPPEAPAEGYHEGLSLN